MQEGQWAITARDATHVTFARDACTSRTGRAAAFDVAVERTVRVLGADDVRARFGEAPPARPRWVAFESDNRITNAGARAWTRDTGLLSIWILGMYAPRPTRASSCRSIPRAPGPIVNDEYFGKVPADRLVVHERRRAGSSLRGRRRAPRARSASARRARATSLGSWSAGAAPADARALREAGRARPTATSTACGRSSRTPTAATSSTAYNDGPTEPGKPSLGGFYELETSSPAAALGSGALDRARARDAARDWRRCGARRLSPGACSACPSLVSRNDASE